MKDLECPFCGNVPESRPDFVVCQTDGCAIAGIQISREKWRVRPGPKRKWTDEIKSVVSYLNDAAGTSYRHGTAVTQRFIRARLNEGFTLEDFELVIDDKVMKWGKDEDMADYLRPQTLFGGKFESYLQVAKREEAIDRAEAEIARNKHREIEEERRWQQNR